MRRMWKVLVLLCLIATAIGGSLPAAISKDGVTSLKTNITREEITLNYTFASPEVMAGLTSGYRLARIQGLQLHSIPGEPMVPYRKAAVLVPAGKEVVSVAVVPGEKKILGTFQLQPAPPLAPLSSESGPPRAEAKAEIYGSSAPFPGKLNSPVGIQYKSGCPIVMVSLYPLQFTPSTQEVSYYNSLTLKVRLADKPPQAGERFSPSKVDLQIIERMVDNPETVKTYSPAARSGGQSRLLNGNYDYVVVTSRALAPSFAPLVQWRESRGLASTLVTVEDIYGAYSGADEAEKIRSFLKDARENNGITYVLLGGDGDGADVGGESGDNIVPARGLWAASDEEYPPQIAGDLYYACLDGSYDGNGNGIYGEPTDGDDGGDVDLLAEIYVGRAPVDSVSEVNNFVAKTIAYESTPATVAYIKKAWMVGELLWQDEPCAAEVAARAQEEREPAGILETLKDFRDTVVDSAYSELYYRYSPAVKEILLDEPGLLRTAAGLLVKYTPALRDLVEGRERDEVFTEEDVAELTRFIHALAAEVEKRGPDLGEENAAELVNHLKEMQAYIAGVTGKTFSAAFESSPYAARGKKRVTAAEPLGDTWGGDYKDEVMNGSSNNGYTTAGFPHSFEVKTLYDRDQEDPYKGWAPEQMLAIMNDGPHLINHLGHSNVTYVMRQTNEDVDGLTNNTCFLAYSQGCYAGSFDNRGAPGKGYLDQDSIGEHLVTGQHGAFAFIGNSRYGWGARNSTNGPSQHFDRQFWDAIFGEGLPAIGVANQRSKEENAQAVLAGDPYIRFVYYELNLLGDPATKVIFPGEGRDLAIAYLDVPGIVQQGEEVMVNARISNLGAETEQGVTVTFLVDGAEQETQTISAIPAGGGADVHTRWTAGAPGSYKFEVVVRGAGEDDNPTNNSRQATVRVSGIFTVDDDGVQCPGADFATVSEAIAMAGPGDTLKLYPGVYGPFMVDKPLNILGVGYPDIDGRGQSNVIEIVADGTRLERVAVRNSANDKAGILVESSNNTITGNLVSGSGGGIVLNASSNNMISHNTLENNDYGLVIQSDSRSNRIFANNIEHNTTGIYIYGPGSTGLGGTLDAPAVMPNLIYENNIGNTTDVSGDASEAGVCEWFDPGRRRGNYWGANIFPLDQYPLSQRYVSGGTVTGKVNLQGRASYAPVTVSVAGTNIATVGGTDGSFILNNVPLGKATLVFSSQGYLNKAMGVNVKAEATAIEPVTLLAGDINADNKVGIQDLTELASAYRKAAGEPGYNPRADLNGDGLVNVQDLALLAGNYRKQGDSW